MSARAVAATARPRPSPRVRARGRRTGTTPDSINARAEPQNPRYFAPSMSHLETDYLVIGSGIAGLTFALDAAEHGRVLIVTKAAPGAAGAGGAQGGISAVLGEDDSFASHVADTLKVGDGLCHPDIVDICVREGPAHVRRLVDRFGADFGRTADGHFDLGREGGHSARRVVRAKDATGREVERALLAAARARADRITILPDHMAVDLLGMAKYGGPDASFGAYVLDQNSGEVKTLVARATVLASGGAGKVYLYTTNPDIATGDGMAMAYRAGARGGNMEFIQFHPTCLYHPYAKSFLISEAVRGEGGILRLKDGTPFMERYHPIKDLAPRDIVARAIDFELKKSGSDCVYLDITHKEHSFIKTRFPNIYEECLSFGFDMTKEPIPVVPAAHYMCGGILANDYGETSIKRLFTIGETACTGLHGANRLASNSLLEALVFANRAHLKAKEFLNKSGVTIPQIPTS